MDESKVIRIPIIAGYSFSVDKLNNHTLYFTEVREKKLLGGKSTGEMKEYTDVIGYYYKFESLLNALVRDSVYRKIESGKIQTVKDYIASIREVSEQIKTVAGGF